MMIRNDRECILIMAKRAVDQAFQLEYQRRIRGIIGGGLAAIDRHARFRPPLKELESVLRQNRSDDEVKATIEKIRRAIANFIGDPRINGRIHKI